MENHAAAHSTIVLRVKIHDCDQCPQKLRKLLLRFDGVYRVDVEPKKEMVTVSGRVEVETVIKYLESKNIKAKFMYSDDKINDHSEDSSSEDVKGSNYKNRHKRRDEKEKKKKKKNIGNGNGNGNGGHVMEAYEAPTIDPTFCRDPYCKLHKSKPTIQSKVPSIHSDDHPKHTRGYSFPLPAGGSHQSFLFGGGFPMMREPPHMMRPPPTSFGNFGPFMPDAFGYYGDAAPNFRGRRGPFM